MNFLKKHILFAIIAGVLIYSCGTQNSTTADSGTKEEPVRIANDSLEYEIIIIDIGFNTYLNTIARPLGYHAQSYLETRNLIYVTEWNNRVRSPSRYSGQIYENVIDYQSNVDYGLEVNYKLFNYFQFAQKKYKMRLSNLRVQN